MRDEVDVAVVGGGAAGIAAARRLMREPGLSVLLLEAGDRLGGRAHTLPGPLPVDLGCAWLHSGLTNAWTAIADAEGFAVDRRPAPWDVEERDLGMTPAEHAAYAEALEDFRARAEADAACGGDGPLSAHLTPGSPWRGMIDAVSTYVSGATIDRISVRDTGDYRPGEGDDWRVVEGYGRLVAHHGRDVPAAFGAPVTLIDHSGAGPVRVETARGAVRARAVVVTASTDVLAAGRIRFAPALPGKAEAAAMLPLGSVEKLWMTVSDPGMFPAEQFCLGSRDTADTAAYHFRPFGRPVVECFLGGDLARRLSRAGTAAALDFARSELRSQLGSEAAAAVEPLHLTRWGAEPHILGSYAYAKPGSAGARARLAEPVDGRLFFAGEATHPTRFTTAHGAYESGVAAAEAVLAALGPGRQPRGQAGAKSLVAAN